MAFPAALSLNGVNQYVATNFRIGTTGIGVSFWFKTSNANSGLFSANDPELGGSTDRNIWLASGNANGRLWNEQTVTTSGLNLADGQWHHIVHTYGSGISGQQLYIDGVLKASGNKNYSDFNWNNWFEVGWANQNGYLNGQIDEFRLYNDRALTQDDVTALYQNVLGGPGGGLSNLIGDLSPVTLSGTARLNLNDCTETVGSLASADSGTSLLLGAGKLTTGGNGQNTSFAGSISGTGGSLVKTGGGTMTLSGTDTYTGGTIVNGGKLIIGSATALPAAGHSPSAPSAAWRRTAQAAPPRSRSLEPCSSWLPPPWPPWSSACEEGKDRGWRHDQDVWNLHVLRRVDVLLFTGIAKQPQPSKGLRDDRAALLHGVQCGDCATRGSGGPGSDVLERQTSNVWDTFSNWDGIPPSTAADVAGFKYGSLAYQPSVGTTTRTIGGIQVDDSSTAVTIGAGTGGGLVLGASGVSVGHSAGTLTINAPITAGSLTKSGGGTLALGGFNTYSGGTTISEGTLSPLAATAWELQR